LKLQDEFSPLDFYFFSVNVEGDDLVDMMGILA
jgi:hypothetical protein